MSTRPVSGSFFSHLYEVVTTPSSLLEGGLWTFFLHLEVENLTKAISKRKEFERLPDTSVEKGEKVWEANKAVVHSSFSFLSLSAITLGWMDKVRLITLGRAYPAVKVMGYGGSSVVCFSRLVDNLKELYQGSLKWYETKDPAAAKALLLTQVGNLLKCATYATLVAWTVLGVSSIILGGEYLLSLMDTFLEYSAFLFFGNILFTLVLQPPKKPLPPS